MLRPMYKEALEDADVGSLRQFAKSATYNAPHDEMFHPRRRIIFDALHANRLSLIHPKMSEAKQMNLDSDFQMERS